LKRIKPNASTLPIHRYGPRLARHRQLSQKLRKKLRAGQWLRIFFDDVGTRDVVFVGETDTGWIRVLEPYEGSYTVSWDQVQEVRNKYIQVPA